VALRKLPRSFYLQPTLKVAKELLGCFLVRMVGQKKLVGRIVEVEAYLGVRDPASHAYRGMTKRNEVMFRKGGHLYVYFTYGMHFCANVVTEEEGIGHAVLLRAVEPVEGIATMQKHRGEKRSRRRNPQDSWIGVCPRPPTPFGRAPSFGRGLMSNLTNGPAKLCEAFGIARGENGTDLLGNEIWIARDASGKKHRMEISPRIGISSGKEHRWRFYVRGNPFVSQGNPTV
jgi:DNA-3-methyladenine glycosylase